ncbi:glycosyltransferase family 39 protein [Occallatibacter savannae]|uniref:glycosyltransferase family 39 protein n=1 Tax=Occallatibacter savannae TaxID=1002691 RepID=UPI000D692B53|nr:glycosyltransferase family 39 protein [Occallatibacter savannae]
MRNMGSAVLNDECSYQTSTESPPRGAGVVAWLDANPVRAFAALTVLYFVVFLMQSAQKLMWLDEFITFHLARLNSFHDLWHALSAGADPNPPLTYLLVHWCRNIFGEHEWAYRLPAALGCWVGLTSLFAFLKRRICGSWAIFGCLVWMSMAAFDYSFESRSYGIFYGLAMLAFLCWTVSIDLSRNAGVRSLALIGMVVSLAAGISTNYFAVLAFLPPALGELVRTIVRARRLRLGAPMEFTRNSRSRRSGWLRAIDVRVWIGLALAATPLLLYRPLIAHSIAQFAPYAWNKVSLDQVFDSYTEMVEIILYPILALLVVAAVVFWSKERVAASSRRVYRGLLPGWLDSIFAPYRGRTPLTPWEAMGVFVFMTYPICGYIIASIRGGMLSPRFVIPVCYGFAIAAVIAARYVFRNVRYGPIVLLCVACAWFLSREAVVGYWYKQQKDSFYKIVDSFQDAQARVPAGSPIVIADPLLALTFQHYAPVDLARRVVFPVDFPAIRYFRKDDSPEENLWAGRKVLYSMPIVPLAEFQHSAGPYMIVASKKNWLLQDLRKHRYDVARLPVDTRANDLGGFTPLARGEPEFYEAQGDQTPAYQPRVYSRPPAPFQVSQNVPEAKWYVPPELLSDE